MIITRLVVHNFGIYRGRFEINLKPPSRNKPVILFGGLNGGGKTTLLDALQLVLYGKLAQCSNRGDLPYDEFLRRSIHRGVPPSDGASLELEFSHASEGREQTYRVLRSWVGGPRGVRERVDVSRSESPSAPLTHDPLLSESWSEQIEEFIPVRLSKFFFFDGEKIEALADLERSTEVLSTAIRSLLGLDLVDQLATDLVVLERRKNALRKTGEERDAIDLAQREVDAIRDERDQLVQRRAGAQNALDRAEILAAKADEQFRLGGGETYERRKEYEAKRDAVAAHVQSLEDELGDLAAGVAPLLLVGDLLDATARATAAESGAEAVGELRALLVERDEQTVEFARRTGVKDAVVARLSEYLSVDRRGRLGAANGERYLGLTHDGRAELADVGPRQRDQLAQRIRRQVAQFERLQAELEDLERMLASTPDEEAISQLATARIESLRLSGERERELQGVDAELGRMTRDYDTKWARLGRLMERAVDEHHHNEELGRIVSHSEGVREVLARFRDAVLQHHVRRIERLILDGLQHLLRKASLVAGLHIDPKTFELSLVGADGERLAPERLSAGERQLLAVSIIWGIARASGRVLPVAVDTPLGRLDSTHRNLLVERYFPHASHQVLLFSTDEEINGEYYEKLRPSIGHAYQLTYDDKRRASTIEEGYPW